MSRAPRLLVLVVLSLPLFCNAAAAECSAPADPGVRICSPTPNATLAYVPEVDFNSTPAFGAEIVRFAVYDNGRRTFVGSTGETGTLLMDASMKNGAHHVVVKAWDNAGAVYQSEISFKVVGTGFPFQCAAPSSPGINFCSPADGSVLNLNYLVAATATGKSRITNMRLYADGVAEQTQANTNHFIGNAVVRSQGDHKITIVAWDSEGNAYNATRTLHSSYTYDTYSCPPKGNDPCTPGFDAISPESNAYVGSSFTISANIADNPHPITAMKAYIDNTLVATSNGPTMSSPVENAPSGTHILTLQAWDSAGVVYRTQSNLNINVPH